MDAGYPEAVATLVGLANGTTSLYFSNGGGMIGGGSTSTSPRRRAAGSPSPKALPAATPFRLPASPARSDLVAKYFRGLGDQTRVRILQLLRDEGELSVGELVERLGLAQPKVSNRLACLRWCAFVEARRERRTVYNRIADQRVLTLLELADGLLDDNAEHVAACCRIDER